MVVGGSVHDGLRHAVDDILLDDAEVRPGQVLQDKTARGHITSQPGYATTRLHINPAQAVHQKQ